MSRKPDINEFIEFIDEIIDYEQIIKEYPALNYSEIHQMINSLKIDPCIGNHRYLSSKGYKYCPYCDKGVLWMRN